MGFAVTAAKMKQYNGESDIKQTIKVGGITASYDSSKYQYEEKTGNIFEKKYGQVRDPIGTFREKEGTATLEMMKKGNQPREINWDFEGGEGNDKFNAKNAKGFNVDLKEGDDTYIGTNSKPNSVKAENVVNNNSPVSKSEHKEATAKPKIQTNSNTITRDNNNNVIIGDNRKVIVTGSGNTVVTGDNHIVTSPTKLQTTPKTNTVKPQDSNKIITNNANNITITGSGYTIINGAGNKVNR